MRQLQTGASLQVRRLGVAVAASTRGYFWPYSENLVPDEMKPSSFQASPVPSVRESIIREYALGPLFGARTPLCVLGFFPPSDDTAGDGVDHPLTGRKFVAALIDKKKALRVALAELLSCDLKEVELGQITMAKEMLLYRAHTSESPKLGDGPGATTLSNEKRLSRYARRPVAARAFMDVYVDDSVFESLEEKRRFAHFVQERVSHHEKEANTYDVVKTAFEAGKGEEATAAEGRAGTTTDGQLTAARWDAFETDMEERARVLDSVADLLELGVVYCEVPARQEDVDGHDYVFDKLHGKEVDLETAEQVLDRWDARLRA